MGKGVKAGLPVISSHAALSEASEPHPAGSQMNDGIVDAAAAEPAAGSNPGCGLFAPGK